MSVFESSEDKKIREEVRVEAESTRLDYIKGLKKHPFGDLPPEKRLELLENFLATSGYTREGAEKLTDEIRLGRQKRVDAELVELHKAQEAADKVAYNNRLSYFQDLFRQKRLVVFKGSMARSSIGDCQFVENHQSKPDSKIIPLALLIPCSAKSLSGKACEHVTVYDLASDPFFREEFLKWGCCRISLERGHRCTFESEQKNVVDFGRFVMGRAIIVADSTRLLDGRPYYNPDKT